MMANYLPSLVRDKDTNVRIAASKAAIELMNKEIFIAIANNLSQSTSRSAHLKHLVKASQTVVPFFIEEFDKFNIGIQYYLMNMANSLVDERLVSFMLKLINHRDPYIRHKSICMLSKYAFDSLPTDTYYMLKKELAHEKHFMQGLIYKLRILSKIDQNDLLSRFLYREAQLSKERIINLLSCFYSKKSFEMILQAIKSGDEVQSSYGIELLSQELTRHDKYLYFYLLNWNDLDIYNKVEWVSSKDVLNFANKILSVQHFFVIPATKAAAIYFIGNLALTDNLDQLHMNQNDLLQMETYRWAQKKLSDARHNGEL